MRWNGVVDLGGALIVNGLGSMQAAKAPNLRWQVVGTDSVYGDGRFIGAAVGLGLHLLGGGRAEGIGRIGEIIMQGTAQSLLTGEVYRRQAIQNAQQQAAAPQPGQIPAAPGAPVQVMQGVDYVVAY